MYRQRFGLTDHPLPKNAQGKTFFDKSPGFKKLERAFRQLIADPGLGVLTADAGVGKTAALRHLRLQQHAPLARRIVHYLRLEPLEREAFSAMIDHAFKAAGATQNILADSARELLFRTSRGLPRVAAHLLHRALYEAHERNQNFIDDHTMEAAIEQSPVGQVVLA